MEATTPEVKRLLKETHRALKANPRDDRLHRNAAVLYEQMGQYEEAVPHLAFLVRHAPSPDVNLYARYVKALQRSMAVNKSLEVVEAGLGHHPESALLLRGKALTYQLMGRFGQAQETYARLYALDPTDEHSAGVAGTIKLLMTDMQDGFEEYARRPLDKALCGFFEGIQRWGGEPLTGKKVAVWSEQGVGDVMMFLGLLPWLVAQKPEMSLVITAKMAPLVARSFPGLPIISEPGLKQMGKAFDYHVPMGDLLSRVLPHYVPADRAPYLIADAERANALRQRYLEYAGQRGRTRLIGVSWHTTNPEVGFTRNVTLSDLQPLLSIPGVQFVSLQYGDHDTAIGECNKRLKNVLYRDSTIDAFNDLDGLAAQMAAVDEVVTIDNATVHMAGALGVPTTLLLSTMPDWRWGLKRSDCHWYRSVDLERQEALGRWQPVVKRVRARLMDTLDAGR